jgi:general stress protein 26
MEQKNDFEKLFKLIEGIDYCMLATEDEDGSIRSRPMATQKDYNDQDLYFFTKKNSGKCVEIQNESDVNLAYAHPAKQHYVSVSGRAELIEDKAKMEKLWNPAYKAWFPDGLEDPEIALIKVSIQKAEYWDSHSSPVVHLIGVAKAMLTGQQYKPGDHGTVQGTIQ